MPLGRAPEVVASIGASERSACRCLCISRSSTASASIPEQVGDDGIVVRRAGFQNAGRSNLPTVVGKDVVDALFEDWDRDADVFAADLRRGELAKLADLVALRRRIEIAEEQIGIASGANVFRHAGQLVIAYRRFQTCPGAVNPLRAQLSRPA